MRGVNLQTLKGFRDFLPADALKRKWLKDIIVSVFERWGYDPMETPTLEPLEIFAGQIGEDEKLFFQFKDPGGRDVALRYDQTVPTCRVVGQYAGQLVFPFRRYQIQSSFRAENPQKGRYREFLQCDADIFGTESPLSDAEVIALSLDIYRAIGFPKAQVLVNDRALLKDIPYEAIVAIDKLQKIGREGVIEDMIKKGIEKERAEEYFNYILNLNPNETITTIFNYLKNSGFDESWYKFEPTLARAFSYSTGPIWEVIIPESKGGSVLGGERYDKLVENISGTKIPATGFAVGFDRTLEAAEEFGLVPSFTTNTKVLVTIFESDLTAQSSKVASILREANINTELYPSDENKLDKQLKYADKKGIPYVVVVGPEEVEKNVVKLKNMKSGEQEELSVEKLIEKVQGTKADSGSSPE
jgi:histidyl-tRNA synthetase